MPWLGAHHAVHWYWRRSTRTSESYWGCNLRPWARRHVLLLLLHHDRVVLLLSAISRKLLLHIKIALEPDACQSGIHANTAPALHLLLSRTARLLHYLVLLRLRHVGVKA